MITSVTTTTTAAMATAGVSSLILTAVLALLALLVVKEVASSLIGARAARLSQALNVAIAPLLVVFSITLVMKVGAVLG